MRGEGLEEGELTDRIIGAAIEVHTRLGPGFLEAIYDRALRIEFRLREIPFASQITIPVLYRDVDIGHHRPDFLINERVILEIKSIRKLENVHFATVRSYLRAAGCRHGLLLNFSQPTLEIRRVWSRQDGRRDIR